MKVAILDDYQRVALTFADWSRVQKRCDITVFDRPIPPGEAVATLQPFDIVCHLRERMEFPRSIIAALPNLKLIVVTGAKHRTLDVGAATDHGIAVSNTDGRPYIDAAATELGWGLLLAVARNIVPEATAMCDGGWQTTVGTLLGGKTLGLLGLGRLGSKMAKYGQAFGMDVIAWSSNLTAQAARAGGAQWVAKEDLFRRSDALSIHLVLGERSRGIVGAADLGMMKAGAILINTSRGPIVDEGALLAALGRGAIRAGIDVFDEEPLSVDHPLRRAPNCVLTPHLGYVTEETYRGFYEDMVADIEGFLAGTPVRLVNPQARNSA